MLCVNELVGFGVRRPVAPPPYVGPYTSLTTSPVVAVDFKRLHAGYTGPLIRLVRADDDAEMDFGYVAGTGLLDTAAIATWLGASAGLGRRWYNQYVAGDDYVQATKANMPTFDLDGLNGGPCFTFDDNNDYMAAALSAAITGTNLFLAALARALTGVDNFDGIINAAANSDLNDFQSATSCTVNWGTGGTVIFYRNGAQSTTAAGTANVDANVVATGRVSGGNLYAGANGAEASAGATSGNFNVQRTWIGARFYNDVPSSHMPVSIAGAVVFGGDPGSTDRGIVVDYLKSVGGIS